MKFNRIIADARSTYGLMREKFPEFSWGTDEFLLQLVEEVGELSNAVLCETGRKLKARQKSTVEDAIFDVFFYLVLLADELGVDLNDAWETGIAGLTERIRHRFE